MSNEITYLHESVNQYLTDNIAALAVDGRDVYVYPIRVKEGERNDQFPLVVVEVPNIVSVNRLAAGLNETNFTVPISIIDTAKAGAVEEQAVVKRLSQLAMNLMLLINTENRIPGLTWGNTAQFGSYSDIENIKENRYVATLNLDIRAFICTGTF